MSADRDDSPHLAARRIAAAYSLAALVTAVLIWPVVDSDQSLLRNAATYAICVLWIASFFHLSWSSERLRFLWLALASAMSFASPLVALLASPVPARDLLTSTLAVGFLGTASAYAVFRKVSRTSK